MQSLTAVKHFNSRVFGSATEQQSTTALEVKAVHFSPIISTASLTLWYSHPQ